MKRILSFTLLLLLGISFSLAGNNSKIRKETRFLTDRMAYELDLTNRQYDDVYEINYDFIRGIRSLTPEIILGNGWAVDRYYDYLDMRNEDLRWVLNRGQYNRFLRTECFFRPAYLSGRNWVFRVFLTYHNHDHFYFPKPHHYTSYKGGHCHYDRGKSYYHGRYSHPTYHVTVNIRGGKSYKKNRHADFRDFKDKSDKRRPARGDDDDDDDDDDNDDDNDDRGWRGQSGRTPAGRGNRVTRPSSGKRTERVGSTRPSSSTENRSAATGIRSYSKDRVRSSSPSGSSRSAAKKSSRNKKENTGSRSLRTGSSRGSVI